MPTPLRSYSICDINPWADSPYDSLPELELSEEELAERESQLEDLESYHDLEDLFDKYYR